MLSASGNGTPKNFSAASGSRASGASHNSNGRPDLARPVETFDVSPALRGKLMSAGFRTVEDLEDVTPAQLIRELGISMEEALSVIRQYNQGPMPSTSALDLLERDLKRTPITTFCAALDSMLDSKGTGVPVGVITEFCGEPGVGKTQIAMQLCVNVQIPKSIGGMGGEALYVDSEGSFIAERVAQIAEATAAEINPKLLSRNLGDDIMKVDDMLDRIHYFRVHDYVEQVAVTHLLEETIKEHPNIKLVVVDSIAFHFRQHSDMGVRTRLLLNISNTCQELAKRLDIAVVMINQMTTKLHQGVGEQFGTMVPALGETWGHCSTHRVVLSYDHARGARKASLVKSPNMEGRIVYYDVVTEGIRDVQQLPQQRDYNEDNNDGDTTAESHRKRPRNE